MNSKKFFILNIFVFFFFSILLTIYFVGPNNVWLNETGWLYGSGDLTNAQLSWEYFQKDDWRFPIGKNPNYGLEISNSIIFTDNIPLLAFIFKLFNFFLYDKFQYFSFWILICFFLQLFFSYILLLKVTEDNLYSFLVSFLFLLSPFLFFRLSYHFSLGAHWILLYTFYTCYFIDKNNKSFHWFILITLSLLIHLYFTLMIFVILACFVLEEAIYKKSFNPFVSLIIKFLYSLFLMYLVGYFESSPINSISTGYGEYKIDLLSFFDPKINGLETWSIFLKDLKITHLEGFNYLGLGIISLFIFVFLLFLKSLKKNENYNLKFFRISNLFILIFLIWALTTNVSVNGKTIFSIELHDYIFGFLSIFSATGRFAWPVIYILLFFSTIYIYKNFGSFYSSVIIFFILLLQISDISSGIQNNSFKHNVKKNYDPIWQLIDNEYEEVRTTYLFNNYGPIFYEFSKILGNLDNVKTDIILNASMDRKKAAAVRYELFKNIRKTNLPSNVAYLIDNKGHLKHLKRKFYNQNFGFFKRDNFWIMLPERRNIMTSNDIKELEKVKFDKVELKKNNLINFKNKFLGFGWSHNFQSEGAWSEGEVSSILMKFPEFNTNLSLIFDVEAYKSNSSKDYSLELFIDDKLVKVIDLSKNKDLKTINVDLDKKYSGSSSIIDFKFEGLISPIEIFESPDARKLGVLLKSFVIE